MNECFIIIIYCRSGKEYSMAKATNVIFVGKKPLMAYVTATLVQLASEDLVTVKARGNSITRAVDVAQIIEKRMGNMGYKIGDVKIGSESLQSQDGRTRNVSTIDIAIVKGTPSAEGASTPSAEAIPNSNNQGKKKAKKKE
jgi:DNA-binding protein